MLKKAMSAVAVVAATAMTAGALSAQETTLDDVLSCHYETIGGLEAWHAVDAVRMHGRMTLGPGMEAPFTVLNARPAMVRIDFTVQGMTGTQAFDGEMGWQVMPFMGNPNAEPMPADQADAMRDDADLDGPLIGHEEKEGVTLEYVGMGEVEGTPAYELLFTKADGDQQTYFLDAEYCLPIRVEEEREMQGQTIPFATVMGDYKEVGGLIMAHSIETTSPAMPAAQVMTIDSVELNPDYDDDAFTMPEDEGGDGP